MQSDRATAWYFGSHLENDEDEHDVVVGYPVVDARPSSNENETDESVAPRRMYAIVEGPALVWLCNEKGTFVPDENVFVIKPHKRRKFVNRTKARVMFFALDAKSRPTQKTTGWLEVPFTVEKSEKLRRGRFDYYCDYTTNEVCSIHNETFFPETSVQASEVSKRHLTALDVLL